MYSVIFSLIFGFLLFIKVNFGFRMNVKWLFKNFGMELYMLGI